jgi:hypothetical protein
MLVLLVGCARGEADGPTSVALTQVDVSVQTSGGTTVRRTVINYESGSARIADIVLSQQNSPAGRYDATYVNGNLGRFDVIDVDGDQGQMTFTYDNQGRVTASSFIAPSVFTLTQEYDYGDDGEASQMSSRMAPATGSPSTSVQSYAYDDEHRLTQISNSGAGTSSALTYQDGKLHMVSDYADGSLGEQYTFAYDGGRVSSVTTLGTERWDVTYGDDGLVRQIVHADPGTGTTTTYTYAYGSGALDGLRFVPDLPSSVLFDLRGESFTTIDFLSFSAASLSASVPSPAGGPVCGNLSCESGESNATCPGDCPAGPTCGNFVCESGESNATCPGDCPPATTCGNFVCESGETQVSCPTDCSPTTSSCAGLCGGSADTCYCDTSCESIGDCCPDYAAECGGGGGGGSCVGLCGGSADTCYCDTSCTELGDCCPDYVSACGV